MRNSVAWMLRQDGQAFPVKIHLYAMGDECFDSEAEVAAFLIATKSNDIELAYEILDIWMAYLIENSVEFDADADGIEAALRKQLISLPYKFSYPISEDELISIHRKLNNYDSTDTLYDFIDSIESKADEYRRHIKDSVNQQFCRVRFGGRLSSTGPDAGPGNCLWFRVSSVGYNWANTIYIFTSSIYRKYHVNSIFICRDFESDNGDDYTKPDYFYKAKDGTEYYCMPIDEYLTEEHEHSPVFSNTNVNGGVFASIKKLLISGHTYISACKSVGLDDSSVMLRYKSILLNQERKKCVDASTFLEDSSVRTQMKVKNVIRQIMNKYSFITDIDVDVVPRENRAGKLTGFEMLFVLTSEIPEIDGIEVSVVSTKPLNTVSAERLLNLFCREYLDYCKFKHIEF